MFDKSEKVPEKYGSSDKNIYFCRNIIANNEK